MLAGYLYCFVTQSFYKYSGRVYFIIYSIDLYHLQHKFLEKNLWPSENFIFPRLFFEEFSENIQNNFSVEYFEILQLYYK